MVDLDSIALADADSFQFAPTGDDLAEIDLVRTVFKFLETDRFHDFHDLVCRSHIGDKSALRGLLNDSVP